MTKKTLFLSFLLLGASSVFAGGLLTNTNQSVHFLRNPALDASTEIDAVYTNPAGLIFLTDGFHFSLNNQSANQTRTITSTFAPFAASNAGDPTKTYLGTTSAPLIPSLQFAYKKNRLALSAAFAIVGGGGKATFSQGLPSFEAPVSMIPLALTAKGINTTKYSVDTYMEGQSYIFGLQVNGSYKINAALSAAVGVRFNMVDNSYLGHLNNIQINPVHPSLNPTGAMMPATTFFLNAATASTGAANSMTPLISAGYGNTLISNLVAAGALSAAQVTQLSTGLGVNVSSMTPAQVQTGYNTAVASYTANAAATADKQLNSSQSGWGVTPIISINYHLNGLNLAAKYEFRSVIDIKNKTTIDQTGLFPDAATTPSDIPALLTIGGEYGINKSWKVSGGFHHFFDSDARMANNKQQYINGGISEYLLGSEYNINKIFLVSAGLQVTRTGITDAYQTDLSYSLNSYSIGFGGAINITPQLRLNLAYFFTNYDKWTKVSTNYNGTGLAGTDVYNRTNNVMGVGLEYKF